MTESLRECLEALMKVLEEAYDEAKTTTLLQIKERVDLPGPGNFIAIVRTDLPKSLLQAIRGGIVEAIEAYGENRPLWCFATIPPAEPIESRLR